MTAAPEAGPPLSREDRILVPFRWKVMGIVVGTTGVLSVLVLAFLYLVVKDRLLDTAEQHLFAELSALVSLVQPELLTYNTSTIRAYLERFDEEAGYNWLAVFDAREMFMEGRTPRLSGSPETVDELWASEPLRASGQTVRRGSIPTGASREPGWVFLLPVRPRAGEDVWGYVYAGVSMAPTLRTEARLRWFVLVSAAVVLVLGWGFASFASDRLTGPIRELISQTAAIAHGDLDRPLDGDYGDELGTLFTSFREMQDALSASRAELERLNAELEERVRDRTGQLRETTAYLERIIRQSQVALVTTDQTGTITQFSSGAENILGVPENEATSGRNLAGLFSDREAAAGMIEPLLQGKRALIEERLTLSGRHREVTADCTISLITSENGAPIGCMMIFIDRTEEEIERRERQALQEQIQQLHRLESLGTLAGGVAHDFNNLLAVILGYSDLLLKDSDLLPPHRERVEQVKLSALRGSEVTQQLLGFARKGKIAVSEVSVNDIVREVEGLLRYSMRPEIRIVLDLQEPLPTITADSAQLSQALMNLVLNAIDAIGETGGLITLRTRGVEADPTFTSFTAADEGTFVNLQVSDDGSGMSSAVAERIFEPFFSTKGRKERSGLGLAMVYGIIKNHGGAILVDSEPGSGTIIDIYLEASPEMAEAGSAYAREQDPARRPADARPVATILLADDEANVLDLYATGLELEGFRCLRATNGKEAVDLLRRHRREVDLVILDLVMPVMDGKTAFEEMQQFAADVPVILASGYARDEDARLLMEKGAADYLRKPFTLDALARSIRRILT